MNHYWFLEFIDEDGDVSESTGPIATYEAALALAEEDVKRFQEGVQIIEAHVVAYVRPKTEVEVITK